MGSNEYQSQILRVNRGLSAIDSARVTKGVISLDASLNNGNSTADEQVTFVALNSSGELGHSSEKHVYFLIGNVRYFQSTGGPVQSTGYGHVRANFLRKKQLSYELFSQTQYDQGRNLDRRLLAGGGIRYRILEELSVGLGAMQEQERWKRIDNEGEIVEIGLTKLSSYITGQITFSEQVRLLMTGYYQTGYDSDIDSFRNRVSADLGLNIKIGKRLDYSLKSTLAYEDRPIIEVSKSVYTISNGLNYRF
jgi:hypothetical protein